MSFSPTNGLSKVPERRLEPGRLDDLAVLESWKKLQEASGNSPHRESQQLGDPAVPKKKLIVVATSGGGITAAYWTALCLTELERRYPDFARHVRVITGASGGMVGAAEYVAALERPSPEQAGPDHRQASRRRRRILDHLRRDSLTPVVREMVLSDLPWTFLSGVQDHDRGQVLEGVWDRPDRQIGAAGGSIEGGRDERGRGLGIEFSSLEKGEQEGWRPSLIVSPMILEGSQRLLISNLNLDGLAGGMEFFKQFPRAKLKLSTALRMNAAFPWVTPAVNLPTDPPLRVLDAGYKENYGVDLATEWLEKHRQWLMENTSGVILIQIRAYPMDASGLVGEEADDDEMDTVGQDANSFQARLGRAMQWATSPLEGVFSVNKGTMLTINDQKVARLRSKFNENKEGRIVFRNFILTSRAAAPLSWYLTDRDAALLDASLKTDVNQKRLGQIVRFLNE